MEYANGLIFMLIAVNIILTSSLIYSDYTNSKFCLIGGNCDLVQNSEYSQMFGIKLNALGLIFFSALLVIYLLSYNKKIPYNVFIILSGIGASFAAYFLYIQFFIIKSACGNCLIIDFTAIIIFVLALYNNKR